MTAVSQEAPPPFEASHAISLVSINDSKIVNVSLYSGRAEITWLYKFLVKTGQNQVTINGLPDVLDTDSLRVEGRGAATIHDVAISNIPEPVVASTSANLQALLFKKEWNQKALERSKKLLASLGTYLSTLNVQHLDVADLSKVIDGYDTTGQGLDEKVTELEKTLKSIETDINAERAKLKGPTGNRRLQKRTAIGIFAEAEGEVEIALIYAVRLATWNAGYDIRVDMQGKEKPITLIYKAGITQDTGEDWNDVPLTLETATPTFGVDIPTLPIWGLSVYKPPTVRMKIKSGGDGVRARSRGFDMGSSDNFDDPGMGHRGLAVSSKGNVSATFRVPGVITVPSDNASHNVTVVQLELDAAMSWVTVPKVDARTHLKAKIKNASDYTLLQGTASVYVDGSFISRSELPLVSPQESFDCPLGLDPSIRITYHPLSKKVSHSGFYSKTSNYLFSQRITVCNTKASGVSGLRVVEQVPVSESELIAVKLVSPGLSISWPDISGEVHAVRVSDGVLAQWEGADEEGFDVKHLGRDGRFHWVCDVPAQGKVNLFLSWEVSAPLRTDIAGL